MAISVYGGKNECNKKCPKNFQLCGKYLGCLDKMSEVNFSPRMQKLCRLVIKTSVLDSKVCSWDLLI